MAFLLHDTKPHINMVIANKELQMPRHRDNGFKAVYETGKGQSNANEVRETLSLPSSQEAGRCRVVTNSKLQVGHSQSC
jgi:hypothetical protein